ncbi:MAG: acetolactate synthase small subunit [Lachnospiraceae bacterium]
MRHVISVYVDNKFGVLARVSGLFMRRGFNIDSLTVGETEDPDFSRITVTVHGNESLRDQVVNQLTKLYNVKRVKSLSYDETTERELLLIKVANTSKKRNEIISATEVYRGTIVDYSSNSITIEITGEPNKISSFIELMKPVGIIELCRTGIVALERGINTLGE